MYHSKAYFNSFPIVALPVELWVQNIAHAHQRVWLLLWKISKVACRLILLFLTIKLHQMITKWWLISRTMIGRDVAVNKWCFPLWKVAMKEVTWSDYELTNDGVRSRFRSASFTFVLAKTGIRYVCFTQKQFHYNILNILIDIHAKYIDQNNIGWASDTTVPGGRVYIGLFWLAVTIFWWILLI